jgi:hypothetical protein
LPDSITIDDAFNAVSPPKGITIDDALAARDEQMRPAAGEH